MTREIKGALGLLRRCGALVVGFDAVAEAAGKSRLHLIILAEDLSARSVQKAVEMAGRYNIDVLRLPVAMDDIADIVGKRAGILGAANKGLAHKIRTEIGRISVEE